MTAPTIIPKLGIGITEAQFQDQIVHVAHLYWWKVAHFRSAQNGRGQYRTAVAYDGKGFPDLVLAHHRGHVIFAEIKKQDGRISDAQHEWMNVLGLCEVYPEEMDEDTSGVPVVAHRLWRPSDWPDIVDLLTFGQAKAVT